MGHEGHEGHESHEQHAFTSPYPSGVAGLVKKRVVSGYARTPLFSTTLGSAINVRAMFVGLSSQSLTSMRVPAARMPASWWLRGDLISSLTKCLING